MPLGLFNDARSKCVRQPVHSSFFITLSRGSTSSVGSLHIGANQRRMQEHVLQRTQFNGRIARQLPYSVGRKLLYEPSGDYRVSKMCTIPSHHRCARYHGTIAVGCLPASTCVASLHQNLRLDLSCGSLRCRGFADEPRSIGAFPSSQFRFLECTFHIFQTCFVVMRDITQSELCARIHLTMTRTPAL